MRRIRANQDVGSPYCVRRYVVDRHLGGPKGLAAARKELVKRGLRLILDFVPNHAAPDHPWITEHPEYFIQGDSDELEQKPGEFLQVGERVLALGRDPFFAPWPDVVQFNGFHPALREAIVKAVATIAEQCDGIRCDMAMLLTTPVFEGTWGDRAGPRPEREYWTDVIQAVRTKHPDVLFMAEAYWDKEWELLQQGFDYCYDKRLYDRLGHGSAESVRLHLCADIAYQKKLVRFIENHDEPRAAATFTGPQARAAAVTVATLPGARLFHQGQFEGRRVRLPVFLRRRPDEVADRDLREFYHFLLQTLRSEDVRDGAWRLCERSGWPDNQSYLNVVAWCWQQGGNRHLIIVELSGSRSQARVRLPWGDLEGCPWRLTDPLQNTVLDRGGDELQASGLYVDLEGWHYHVLRCERC